MQKKLYNQVLTFIQQEQLLQKGDRILVACSGGVDSVALLHFLSAQRSHLKLEIGAIHVDHCLRGEASVIDGKMVESLCTQLEIPFYGTTLPVPALLEEEGGNVQEICRRGRYELFEKTMCTENFSILAVGHHAEDQLETILMQIAKGQRPNGMPVTRSLGKGKLIRPFLSVMKHDLYEYAASHNLPFREDPSNEKDDYTRNRYRHQIVPELLRENQEAAHHSVRISAGLQEDDDFLQIAAQERLKQIITLTKQQIPVIDSTKFRSMHLALQKRAVPLLLRYLYDGETIPAIYNADLLNQLMRQLSQEHGSGTVSLPNGWLLQRDYNVSTFVKLGKEKSGHQMIPFPQNEWIQWGHYTLLWCQASDVDPATLDSLSEWRYFQSTEDALPSLIRSRQPGDRISLSGMKDPKRLNRLLIDEKVNRSLRDEIPIIVSKQEKICAIPGVRYSASFSTTLPETKAYILMMIWPDQEHHLD